MPSPLQLPYYAPDIPYPLPTKCDIKAATLISDGAQRIVNIDNCFVVKYGPQVSPIEGENMMYIKQYTHVRIPHVYAIFCDPEEQCNYIIMEYVRGETLASAWSFLNYKQKDTIATILKRYMEELRALPSPGYFGSIWRRHLLDSMFWTPEQIPSISGPFDTEADFNEAMALKYVHFGAPIFKADFYRRAFPKVLNGHPAVFTHADFQRKNIIIEILPENGICVTLVDWEKSGWMPSYWEYAMAMLSDVFVDDWNEWLCKILEPFYAEYPYLKMLQLELWS